MSYWVHEIGNKNNAMWRFYQCDYLTDIDKLPTASKYGEEQPNDTVCKNKCAPGSKCLCQEDGSIWLLGKDTDKWVKKKTSISCNGSGNDNPPEFDIQPIPRPSIESLFS